SALAEGGVDLLPVRDGAEPGGGGDDRTEGQQPLADRAEVADEAGIGLLVQLLRGGAGGDDAVEAGDGAAGDGHEQQRHQARGALGHARVHRGRDDLGPEDQHRAVEQAQRDEQLQAVEVVARLQQHPHRQHRGDRGVDEQHDDPERLGGEAQHRLRQHHRDRIAQQDQGVQRDHPDDRDDQQAPLQPVDRLPDQHSHHERAPGGDDGGGGGDQQARDDDGEGRVDHEQQQEDDHQEQSAAAGADVPGGERPDGLAAVADRGPQRAEVVHAGEEDGAQGDSEEGGQPAPDDGDGGADDGRGTRDRGEVVAPQDELVGGDEVDAVLQLMGGGAERGAELEHAPAEETGVEQVAGDHHGHADHDEDQGVHGALLAGGARGAPGQEAFERRRGGPVGRWSRPHRARCTSP